MPAKTPQMQPGRAFTESVIGMVPVNNRTLQRSDNCRLLNPKYANMTDAELQKIGEDVVDMIRTIYDPEIPVDIYELGLIYDVQVSSDCDVKVLMTLTTPNCPVAESLPEEVKQKVGTVENVKDVEVELTFEPPWNKEMMSEEAMLELGFM